MIAGTELMDLHWLLVLFLQHPYLLVFLFVFLDNVGLPMPGELALLAFGLLARTGDLDLAWGVVAAGAGAMAGDNASYWLGRLGGVRVLHTYCRVTLGSGECVDRAVTYYHRFGSITVVLGRFVMGLRAFLMPLAGSARVPYGQFLLSDAVGTFLWSGLFIGAGYAFGDHVDVVGRRLRSSQIVLASTLATAFFAYLALKLWKRHRFGVGLLAKSRP